MSDVPRLQGPEFGPASGGPAKQVVILLHGWGADGNDLIGLAPPWSRLLPEAVFLSPHGPGVCDIGMGRQWFSLEDRRPEAMLLGAQAAAPAINAFIDDALEKRQLGNDALGVVGFSQGTMMALYVMPRRLKPCAAIVGYSGALLGADTLAREAKARPPVMLVHGAADPIVHPSALEHATVALKDAGFAVDAHLRSELGHGIDEEGLALGGRFLQQAFGIAVPARP